VKHQPIKCAGYVQRDHDLLPSALKTKGVEHQV
jgi:hypothetical protein